MSLRLNFFIFLLFYCHFSFLETIFIVSFFLRSRPPLLVGWSRRAAARNDLALTSRLATRVCQCVAARNDSRSRPHDVVVLRLPRRLQPFPARRRRPRVSPGFRRPFASFTPQNVTSPGFTVSGFLFSIFIFCNLFFH